MPFNRQPARSVSGCAGLLKGRLAVSDAARGPVTLRHATGHFPCGHTPNRSDGPARGPAGRPFPHHAERGTMEGRSRRPAGTSQRLSAVHADLVQLEQLVDRFRVALAGGVQQPPALVQFFFFSMRGRSSFHQSKPFFCALRNAGYPRKKLGHYILRVPIHKGLCALTGRFS